MEIVSVCPIIVEVVGRHWEWLMDDGWESKKDERRWRIGITWGWDLSMLDKKRNEVHVLLVLSKPALFVPYTFSNQATLEFSKVYLISMTARDCRTIQCLWCIDSFQQLFQDEIIVFVHRGSIRGHADLIGQRMRGTGGARWWSESRAFITARPSLSVSYCFVATGSDCPTCVNAWAKASANCDTFAVLK